MNPLRASMLASFCSGILDTNKKLLKQSGISKTSAAEAADNVILSSEAAEAQQAQSQSQASSELSPQEKFLASASAELSQLDSSSPSFFYESASVLVKSALKQAFGEVIASNPGYPQMQEKIIKTIASDERYREIMEDFLDTLNKVNIAAAEREAQENEEFSEEFYDQETDGSEPF